MNDQTGVGQPSAQTTPVQSDSAAQPDAVVFESMRRRRRRRRRRRDAAATPAQRIHFVVLGIIIVALVLAIIPGLGHRAIAGIRHMIPGVAIDISRRLEVVALIIAGLIMVYLTPGVEEKVLRAIGIKREKRGGRRS